MAAFISKNKKLNRDHVTKVQSPMVEDEVIANQIEVLLTPAITAQENYYCQLGLGERILNLPPNILLPRLGNFAKKREQKD